MSESRVPAEETRALQDRVYGCVPTTGEPFAKLLGLLSVEVSREVPTACVTTGASSRLLVNPDFVAKHCRTDDHLAMLILHELYHVLLGHTRLFPRVTLAQNWAFDCVINAQLCRLFPGPRHTSFFRQFVKDDGSVLDLLAPPPEWSPASRERSGGRGRFAGAGAIREAHRLLYSDESVTTAELLRLLPELCAQGTVLDGSTLLGNHDPGEADELHPEALREVREIVARWPLVERRSGRDQGGTLAREQVPLGRRRQDSVAVLRAALRWAAGPEEAGLVQRLGRGPVAAELPFDVGRDRRAALQRLLGAEPMLFAGEASRRSLRPTDRVRVYLDVSGSMAGVLPCLYVALASCLEEVEPVVYGFSTRIGRLTHADLRKGIRLTNGGTEIEAVTSHLLASTARRAIVLTDGFVGRIPADHAARIARRRVRVAAVVTRPGDASFAQARRMPVFRLPDLAA